MTEKMKAKVLNMQVAEVKRKFDLKKLDDNQKKILKDVAKNMLAWIQKNIIGKGITCKNQEIIYPDVE